MNSGTEASCKGGRGRRPSRSLAKRAGLLFPVGRIGKYLRKGRYSDRIGACAPVYLAAVLEYLAEEVLFAAGDEAKIQKKHRIKPTQIRRAVDKDEDLHKLFENVTIPNASVTPHIHIKLLP